MAAKAVGRSAGEGVLHCPQCYAEYLPGTKVCADCLIPLVEGPAPEREYAADAFVELLRTNNSSDLAVVKSLLDEAGVGYFVQGERLNLFPAIVMVEKEDESHARDILKGLDVRFLGNPED